MAVRLSDAEKDGNRSMQDKHAPRESAERVFAVELHTLTRELT